MERYIELHLQLHCLPVPDSAESRRGLDPTEQHKALFYYICGFGFWYMYTGGERRAYDTRPRRIG